jgi:hypothetical protein
VKLLAVGRPREGADVRGAISRQAPAEMRALWALYRDGTVREMYSPGGPGAVLVLEAETKGDAMAALAALLALALAASPAQAVYVTWLSAHAVVAVRPDGSQMAVSLPPGEATGIAIDPVADGRLAVGLISADPQAAGIWTVPLTAFAGHGAPSRPMGQPSPRSSGPGWPSTISLITRSGTAIAAVNISDEVVRFTRNGPVSVIADEAHQGVENPSAVAFGPGRRLFITSAARISSRVTASLRTTCVPSAAVQLTTSERNPPASWPPTCRCHLRTQARSLRSGATRGSIPPGRTGSLVGVLGR